jgi:hypothetical protein
VFHTSLEDEQQLAELTGLAQTASRMAVLLYDVEAGQRSLLADPTYGRLSKRAFEFLRAAKKASKDLDNNNLANLLGSDAPGVSYYRYYIEARKLMGFDVDQSDKALADYLQTLRELRSASTAKSVPSGDARQLADFFLRLGRLMLGYAVPVPEPDI